MPQPPSDEFLAVRELSRDFGGVHAVAGVSLSAQDRQITGLIGPNGAGKSTVLSMIAGALRPSSGSISFRDDEIAGLPAHKVAHHGIVRTFQISSEFTGLTVMENLLVAAPGQRGESLGGALLGKRWWRGREQESVATARDLLSRFDMSDKEDEYAGNLSGGQKRLLEIMRGLMAKPALLLLDEPMAGVNPSLTRRVEQHLLDLRNDGLAMVMVEHEFGVIERLCDIVVVMAEGHVIAKGTMPEMRANEEVVHAYLVG
jgi:neutral amino acid transport system ATP-binding protein